MPSKTSAKDLIASQMQILKEIEGKKVEAGWFETARYRQTGDKKIPANLVGQPVAKIARINEFGTATIPARPFMRLAFAQFKHKKNEIVPKIMLKVIQGKITPKQALAQIGMVLEGEIVDSIKNGPWPPNAESTEKKKGFNKPLIDTSQMFQSVSSKVS